MDKEQKIAELEQKLLSSERERLLQSYQTFLAAKEEILNYGRSRSQASSSGSSRSSDSSRHSYESPTLKIAERQFSENIVRIFNTYLLEQLEQKPESWKKIFEKFKVNFFAITNKDITFNWSWKFLDEVLFSNPDWNWNYKREQGISLLEISLTKAALEPGLLSNLFNLYENDYNTKITSVLRECSDKGQANILHYIAGSFCRKHKFTLNVKKEDWVVYNEIVKLCPELESKGDYTTQTAEDIIRNEIGIAKDEILFQQI